MTPTYKLRKVGGGLVVTIPRHIIKLIPVDAGDEVTFTISTGGRRGSRGLIIMEPLPKKSKRSVNK